MDPAMSAVVLVAAGAAMGFVNNLAGAGGLIGLAALEIVAGLSLVDANAALRPAAIALTTAGVLGFWSKGQRIPGRAWLYGLASAPGAVIGSMLAIRLPPVVYQVALALVIVAVLAQQLWPTQRRDLGPVIPPQQPSLWLGLSLFSLVGLHMGFLQVAVGLLAMVALTRVVGRNLVEVNAAKMAVLAVSSIASVSYFASHQAIDWTPALLLALGAAIGSFAAGRWTVRKGHGAVRIVVLVVCAFVIVRLVVKLFSP